MATGEALLALLLIGPRHGYDLKRSYDEWFEGLRPLAFGQVYSTLGRLQRDDFVRVAHTETADGPERVIYELTELGRGKVRAWLNEPADPEAVSAEDLIRKTLAAYRLNAEPDAVLARQRTAHLRAMRALEPKSESQELSGAVLLDYRRLHLDADLRWLELTSERVRAHPLPRVRVSLDSDPTALKADENDDQNDDQNDEGVYE
jgi:DNA-binding PadR family transcriptional regulator